MVAGARPQAGATSHRHTFRAAVVWLWPVGSLWAMSPPGSSAREPRAS